MSTKHPMLCETCGEPTIYLANTPVGDPCRRCDNCYRIEEHIDKYLESRKGQLLILEKLKVLELKRSAAIAIEMVDEDELEEYATKLKEANAITFTCSKCGIDEIPKEHIVICPGCNKTFCKSCYNEWTGSFWDIDDGCHRHIDEVPK